MSMATWRCKIGEVDRDEMKTHHPQPADQPMREAVATAYREITGHDPQFIFSGWGAHLAERERAVVEDRKPLTSELVLHVAHCTRCNGSADLDGDEYRASPEEAIKIVLDEAGWQQPDPTTLICDECLGDPDGA